jgi:predicted transcriptional regulator
MIHLNNNPNRFVTVKKCAELYGLTENAIRQYIKKGQWRERIHFFKSPNGRIFINTIAVNEWIVG